jgi:hypothetical protein
MIAAASSCATTGKYDEKVQTWEGKDSASLLRSWGEPDAKEKLHNGDSVYVYSRLKQDAVAYGGTTRDIASHSDANDTAKPVYIKCTTYFTVDQDKKITYVMYRGDECKARD